MLTYNKDVKKETDLFLEIVLLFVVVFFGGGVEGFGVC